MKYTIAMPPEATRIADAYHHTEAYLGTELTDQLPAIFSQCTTYRQWSFCLAMAGIEGWPVAAIWDDLRQTCRDSQS